MVEIEFHDLLIEIILPHCKSFCAKSGHSVGKFESRYLILCALHLARPLSECVIGMGKIG